MAFDVAIRFSVAGADQAAKALGGIGDAATASANQVEPAHRRIRDGVESISTQLDRLHKGFQFIAGISFAGLGLRELAELTDTFKNLNARMELSTGSAAAARAAFNDLLSLANGLQMPLEETATLFNRMSPALKGLGASQEQVIALAQVLGATLKTSGATAAESSSFMLQFSQAMAAGALRGEDFNSVSQANPRLMRALADGLGVAQGKLKQMASDGQLTAESVFNALSKQAETLNGEAAKMPATFSGMLTQMRNNTLAQVGELDQKLGGVSDSILKAFNTLLGYKGAIIDLFIAGAKVAAAYFALFVAAPVVIGAVGTAMLALRTAMLQYQIAAAVSGSYTTALAAAFGGATTASFALTGAVTKLQLAFGVLFAAFAGWQIGTWLRENFVEANLAGIAFVAGTLKGWEAIKYGAQVAWAYIGAAWRSSIEGMGSVFAWFLDKIAVGLGAMGLSAASKQMTEWATSTRDATKNSQSLDDELRNLKEGYDAAASQITRITDEMADEAIAHFKVTDAADKNHAVMGKLGGSKRELSKDQKNLLDELKKELDKLKEQNATYGQGEDAVLRYRAAKEGLTAQSARIREAIAAERAGLEAKKAATEASKKAIEEVTRAYEEEVKAVQKSALSAVERVAKLRDEEAALAFSKQANVSLAQAVELVAIKRLEEAAIAARNEGKQEALDALNAEIKARKDLVGFIASNEVRDANAKAVKEANEAWSKLSEDISRGLTDSLYRAFEAGKGFFETLWSGIKNTFKTTVLKMVVQAVMSPVNAALGGMMGAGNAMAGTGASSGVGSLVGSALGGFGSALSSGFGMALNGGMGVALEGGMAMLGSASGMSSALAGIGQIAGALGPIALGLGAIYAIAKSVDHSGTQHTGSTATADAKGAITTFGQNTGINFLVNSNDRNAKLDQPVLGLASGGASILNMLSGAFGKGTGYSVSTGYADDTSRDGAFGALKISNDGRAVLDWESGRTSKWAPKTFADGDAGWQQYLEAFTSSTKSAIDQIGLPEWAKKTLDALGGAPTLEQLATAAAQISSTQLALKQVGETFAPFGGVVGRIAGLSADATLQLAGFAGGMDALIAKTRSYVDLYYSDSEKNAINAAAIKRQLAAAGIDANLSSKNDLRTLIDSVSVDTEAGRKQLAALLDIAQVFAPLGDYLKDQGKTLNDLAAQAPQVAALDSLATTQQAGQEAQLGATQTLNASVINIGDQISASVAAMAGSLGDRIAGLEGALTAALSANARAIGDSLMEAKP